MIYGSYIRQGEKNIFNSLSKLYMISNMNGKDLTMELNGQPHLNAAFLPRQKPLSFLLNQTKVKPDFVDNTLQIRIDRN
jgi:hypothetical protein